MRSLFSKKNEIKDVREETKVTIPNEYKIPKPENPISFKSAEEECSTCIVRPACAEPCPKVLEIYRSHVVENPHFDQMEHERKYRKEYKEMWEKFRKVVE